MKLVAYVYHAVVSKKRRLPTFYLFGAVLNYRFNTFYKQTKKAYKQSIPHT